MDEFHFYGDPERGWAWQVPLVELPQAQFLLMSATLGDVTRFREDLLRRTGREAVEVTSVERPVPLTFEYCVEPLHEQLEELLATKRAPVYVVHFTQAQAIERAQALMSVNLCTREEKDAIAEAIGAFRFATGFGKTLSPAGAARHRRPPRRDAAGLPAPGRAARPAGPAQGRLRHRHARRRHQRPDPHGAADGPREVRRQPHAPPAGPRVPPDRRPRGAGRLRHQRHGRRHGARARHRERPAREEGRRRPEEAQAGREEEARRGHASAGASRPSSGC